MKLQFLHALFVPDRGRDLRASHSAIVRALPYAFAACNDAHFRRNRLACRWQRNPETGRLEARWTKTD